MPMVSLKLMAGAARSMVVASARTTAAEIAARWCARKVWGEDRERPYRVESFLCESRLPPVSFYRYIGVFLPVYPFSKQASGTVQYCT
jgi:hypothetical protein